MPNTVRELRTALGWTQAELALRLKVSRNSVNAIETGRYQQLDFAKRASAVAPRDEYLRERAKSLEGTSAGN